MKRIRYGLIIVASIIIIVQVVIIDYDDFSWSTNGSKYLGVISMMCLIIAMVLSNRHENKTKN